MHLIVCLMILIDLCASANPAHLDRRATKQLSLHDVETTFEPIEVAGPEGCTALFLYGWTTQGVKYVTEANIMEGRDDSPDIEKAVLQALHSGDIRSLVVTAPLTPDPLTYRHYARGVVDKVLLCIFAYGLFVRPHIHTEIRFYEPALLPGTTVAFSPNMLKTSVDGLQVFGGSRVAMSLRAHAEHQIRPIDRVTRERRVPAVDLSTMSSAPP